MTRFERSSTVKNFIKKMSIRSWVIVGIFSVLVSGLMWRLFDLHVLDQQFLRTQGDARSLRTIPISAHRGIIADRNDEPLAVSAPVASVWANPKDFDNTEENIELLASYLDLTADTLREKLSNQNNKEFVYLQRQLAPSDAQQVQSLNLAGIHVEREYRRYYPTGEATAHVLGFTNIDGEGQEGVELEYDQILSGAPGARQVIKDRLGRVIDEIEHIRDPKAGQHLNLSIDRRIQYLAYLELLNSVEENDAESGSVVVVDVKTGEVLAMANYPSYNPNNRLDRDPNKQRNRAATDVFEPGSVMKVFSMAAGLSSGSVIPETIVDTNPGTMQVRGKTVRDTRNFGVLDMAGVLQYSSNVGIAQVILATPFETYVEMLHELGFGSTTATGFPGERTGQIQIPAEHDDHSKVTLAFGYGLSVTPLQLAQAYSIIANDGEYIPLTLLRSDDTETAAEPILDPALAQELQAMLTQVVHNEQGASKAKVSGYKVAGKSGTARKSNVEGGYEAKRYTSVFAGFAPASDPQLVTVIVVDDPKSGAYYGNQVAAPVFSKVMSGALRLLNIPPDAIQEAIDQEALDQKALELNNASLQAVSTD